MAKSKSSLKKTVTITAIISFISFLYKFGLGIWTMSIILMIAAVSVLLVLIAKIAFIKNVTKSRNEKKKAYTLIAVLTLFYSLIFIAFSVLKGAGIDTSNQKTYEGWLGSLLIAFMVLMFVLSLLGLKGALKGTDIMVIGLKEITFVSALTDLVIIEDFISRIVLQYQDIDITFVFRINSFFVLGISILMLVIPIVMIVRSIRYKAD